MQQDSHLWALLLQLVGNLLDLHKYSYHVPDTPLQLKQANTNKDVTITYKSMFNPYKTLGHYKAPAGKSKVQENILINKAERYA
eukprot:7397567-Ditylum_brightwellii.AAC.1